MSLVAPLTIVLALICCGCLAAPEPLAKPAVNQEHVVKTIKLNHESAPPDDDAAFFESCSQAGTGWINYRQHCYLFVERLEYWYVAEQYCKSLRGNLVGIRDSAENNFVSRLTYCQRAWTGRYAVNVDQLSSPANYRWSDNVASHYHAHDFSTITSIHEPLISIYNMSWHNNVYHARQQFVCKVPHVAVSTPRPHVPCQANWKFLNGFCYHMPQFPATYIEADYYCRGRNAYVASLHTDQEVRAVSLLDLASGGCPTETWIGLVKLNPCRVDFSTGASICYRWSDRSGDYNNFPRWQAGSPNNDTVTNCIALKDRSILSVRCYERHPFVCKKRSETP